MAERIDLFRRALAGATRALAKDPEIDSVRAALALAAEPSSETDALERRLAQDGASLVIAGSTSNMFSNEKIAPQFSIAPKNWLVPGPATLSSLGSG